MTCPEFAGWPARPERGRGGCLSAVLVACCVRGRCCVCAACVPVACCVRGRCCVCAAYVCWCVCQANCMCSMDGAPKLTCTCCARSLQRQHAATTARMSQTALSGLCAAQMPTSESTHVCVCEGGNVWARACACIHFGAGVPLRWHFPAARVWNGGEHELRALVPSGSVHAL